jgi:CHAT domain-containing protein
VFLPLHAAGIYQGTAGDQACCSDYFVSSYTPTISTLLRAQAQASAVNKSGVDMLLVGEDCASGPMPRIPSVQKELRGIEAVVTAKQFGRTMEVIRSAATVERVAERAKSAHFLHLACHGIQHWTDALESHFYLSNGPLTISKLMNLELDHPWLAYLSACETAKGDTKQPDQVMHLAAAMLFAGFKHVVATMW